MTPRALTPGLLAPALLLAFAGGPALAATAHRPQAGFGTVGTASLPSVTSGHRPGPDVLYAPEPAAPQLENRDPAFRAPALRVSGTEAYAAGEYLYQDYLYDDHGSNAMPVDPVNQTASDPTAVPGPGSTLSADALAYQAGSITYPTDPAYADNAADLVEFRVAVGPALDTYRFTLDTLRRKDTTIVSLALDLDRNATTGTSTLPRDPGAPFPGTDAVLTTWGTGAEVSTFSSTGALLSTVAVPVTADLEAAQLTVKVPHTVLHPTAPALTTLATGLFDKATGGWLKPVTQGSATSPGGAGVSDPTPSGIFNLGFRFTEPIQTMNTPPDTAQAAALAKHSPTTFAHAVDFAALYAKASRSTVPATGLQVRFYASRLNLGGGANVTFPQERGQLQPYSVYIPTSGARSHPHPLTLSIHSNGQHYWQYNGTKIFTELGEQRDSVVLSPLGRGHDGWYVDTSEDDVFESWADVARYVSLDPNRTAITGYSMGGYASYRLGGLYPDLFAKAFTVVGPPGKKMWIPPMAPSDGIQTLTNLWLENTRNVPFLNLNHVSDELVPLPGPQTQNLGNPALPTTTSFDQLGYRFRWLLFPAGEHYTLAALGYDFPIARDFLADTRIDRNPAHVTFARVPGSDNKGLGLVHDHAYWVSDVTIADASAGPGAKGVLDIRSHGFGVGDPASAVEHDAGVMGLPYVETGRTWSAPPAEAVRNRLDVTATNLAKASVALSRAKVSPTRPLTVQATADRATALTLLGAFGKRTVLTVDGVAQPARVTAQGVTLTMVSGTHTYLLTSRGGSTPAPRTGTLPTTGLPAGLPLLGGFALLLAVRARRTAGSSAP